jgi:DNA modification methylase
MGAVHWAAMAKKTTSTGKQGADAARAGGGVEAVRGNVGAEAKPDYSEAGGATRVYVGDCRDVLPRIGEVRRGEVDLVFADPPFNWNRAYDKWDDQLPDAEYLAFTYRWLDLSVDALRPHGAIWVNIPDDWAAEIVMHLKGRGLKMINWCIWHYRFGQNNKSRFINSKVHALYFAKNARERRWNLDAVLEPSDRATTYFDKRTLEKSDGVKAGMRSPMDVWYGQYWGRIQGNNEERRPGHDNQLPEVYLERVIKACSNQGDLVLDPFNGSGTTGTVARALGRRFIGTEYSADLAAAAWERITKIGAVRVGKVKNEGSAIFRPRKASKEVVAKFKGE